MASGFLCKPWRLLFNCLSSLMWLIDLHFYFCTYHCRKSFGRIAVFFIQQISLVWKRKVTWTTIMWPFHCSYVQFSGCYWYYFHEQMGLSSNLCKCVLSSFNCFCYCFKLWFLWVYLICLSFFNGRCFKELASLFLYVLVLFTIH